MLDYSRAEGREGDDTKIDGWVEVIFKGDVYVFGVRGS